MKPQWVLLLFPIPFVVALFQSGSSDPQHTLLNVSYDSTRELYRKVNQAFVADYRDRNGIEVKIRQSHGGSGSQVRTVLDGSPADVVTLALWQDTDVLRQKGMVFSGWEDRLPYRSLPYYSTIVMVVRKGNPKGIHDWSDLLQPGVSIITANPKTGGGAKLCFLAAWGSVIRTPGKTEEDAVRFVTQLYQQVPVLDSGARGATVTFARRMIGDVHLTWESEALLEAAELSGEVEVIYPSSTIRAEPHVAVVDTIVDRKGTRALAEAYLQFLYTAPAQRIIGENYFRSDVPTGAEFQSRFRTIPTLFRVEDVVPGGWKKAHDRFFRDGALFDQIYSARRGE